MLRLEPEVYSLIGQVYSQTERLSPWTEGAKPLIKVKGLPSFAQGTVTRQGKKRMVHLLTYLPELRGKKMPVIEEPIAVPDVSFKNR